MKESETGLPSPPAEIRGRYIRDAAIRMQDRYSVVHRPLGGVIHNTGCDLSARAVAKQISAKRRSCPVVEANALAQFTSTSQEISVDCSSNFSEPFSTDALQKIIAPVDGQFGSGTFLQRVASTICSRVTGNPAVIDLHFDQSFPPLIPCDSRRSCRSPLQSGYRWG